MGLSLEMFLTIGMLGALLVGLTHLLAGKAKQFLVLNTLAQAVVLTQGFLDQSMYVIVICIMIMMINVGAYLKEVKNDKGVHCRTHAR